MSASTDTLFYDGNCPLCAHEIHWLKRLYRPSKKTHALRLLDIHTLNSQMLNDLGVSKIKLLEVLHLRNINGQLLLGLDATAAAWSHTHLGWLFAVLRWPFIQPIADKAYYAWAAKRACNLDGELR